ncbi:MAG: glycosyltransferase family 2 protein [Hamadaea sp.]|nr:glycosyltransferase family 2 protein [Hamadaea sp.]NUR47314.1 glycosyltransferase family 2 protein [Hamadaea sp.]NUT03031.1 glycosyltransferase family 2 protein [Hamadaea sp.]
MISGKRVLVVIPAFNEAGAIAGVIDEVRGELPGIDVLVVDDGSADTTVVEARKAGALVARLPYNLGVGGARRLGFRYGLDHDYDVVIQFDADGQHDPRYIPQLVDALDTADVVIGARFAGEGDYRVRGPRAWAMSLLSAVLSRVAKSRLTDTTSGFRAANRRGIDLYAQWFPVEYLGDTVETIVQAVRGGLTVRQVPVAMRARVAGKASHSPVKATVYLGRSFAVLLLALVRR